MNYPPYDHYRSRILGHGSISSTPQCILNMYGSKRNNHVLENRKYRIIIYAELLKWLPTWKIRKRGILEGVELSLKCNILNMRPLCWVWKLSSSRNDWSTSLSARCTTIKVFCATWKRNKSSSGKISYGNNLICNDKHNQLYNLDVRKHAYDSS